MQIYKWDTVAVEQVADTEDVARRACNGHRQQQRMIANELRSDRWHPTS